MVVPSPIGESLRAARERLGWSREALAYHSGVSWSAITQIESGRRRDVRITSLVALAEALGTSIDYLVGADPAIDSSLLVHRALVYRSDEEFLAVAMPFLSRGVQRSDRVLVVTSKARIEQLREAVGDSATNVTFEDAAQWYRSPTEAISRYRAYIREQLAGGALWLRIIGEPGVPAAQAETTWARYEALFNIVFAAAPVTVCCSYDARVLPPAVIDHVHRTHPELATTEAGTANPRYESPEQTVLAE